jgi:hypothetical protein
MQAHDSGPEAGAADKVLETGMPSMLLSFSDDFEATAVVHSPRGPGGRTVHWAARSWDYSRWGPGAGCKSPGHADDGGNPWTTKYLDLS